MICFRKADSGNRILIFAVNLEATAQLIQIHIQINQENVAIGRARRDSNAPAFSCGLKRQRLRVIDRGRLRLMPALPRLHRYLPPEPYACGPEFRSPR